MENISAWGKEGELVVSLPCAPAYGSEVGLCDAGFVGPTEVGPSGSL